METDERQHLEQLLDMKGRRLRELEKQAAFKGNNTPPEVHMEMEDIRATIADLTERITSFLPPGHIAVNLFSYPGTGPTAPAQHTLDWAPHFNPELPAPDLWRATLLPELNTLLGQLSQNATRLVALRPKAHISAGYAFGYTFRNVSGFQIWIEQKAGEWWRTTAPPAGQPGLLVETEVSDPQGADTTIEVSVAFDVRKDARRYIEEYQLPIRERVQLTMPQVPGVVQDAGHAIALAHAIRSAIVAARQANSQQTIHLFGAMPIGLAVLLGAQLNACEPVQCYEYQRPANIYRPACLLA